MHSPKTALVFSLAVVLITFSAADLPAATIAWGPATNISGEADVSLNGTLVSAVNPGQFPGGGGAATTVNGVNFIGFAPANMGPVTDPSGVFTLETVPGFGIFSTSGLGSPAAPFSTLTSAYQRLLDFADYSSDGPQTTFNMPITMTINGLTVGVPYEFQFWFNDSRPFSTGPLIATTGVTSVSLDPNTTNAPGGLGQFAVGTFVADATTQQILFTTTGNAVGHSAYQLRVVPEPGAGLLGAATMLLATRRGRRNAA